MRLNSIKLSGFKSFAEPTHFQLPGQLVGVVGPNGCGKSNIMDAVRWVLGESKASELRGESMQDVIFNGSELRKPANRASVELIFNNEDARAGGQWNQFSEIAAKRVLTRDGTSSYYINNQPVRRRDVQDVFLGTGLGPRTYAVIGQGTISRIIESKPEELRLYLEEAAGVSKYKERRRETEHRLEDTREHLTRVDDILRELNANLTKLEAQAEVAARYRSLQELGTLKQHQLWFLKHRDAASDQARVARQMQEATNTLEAQLAELRHAEAQMESVRQAHYAASDDLHAAQGALAEAALEVSRLEERIRYVVEGRKRVEQRLLELQAQNTQWRQRQEQAQHDLGRVDEQIAHADEQGKLLAEQVKQQAERLPGSQDAVRLAQDRSNEQRLLVAAVQQQIQVLAAESRNTGELLRQLTLRQERLVAEEKALAAPDQARLSALQSQHDAAAQAQLQAEALLERLSEEVPAIDADRRAQQEQLNLAAARQADVGARLEALRTLQDKVKTQEKLKPWLLKHGLDGLQGLWTRIHVEPGWETALEAALRERINALAVGQIETVRAFVEDAPPARLVFYAAPAEATASAPPALQRLSQLLRLNDTGLQALLDEWLAGVYTAPTIDAALSGRVHLSAGEVIMTPAGHAVSQFAVSFYAPDSEQAGMLARAQEIEDLGEQLRVQSTATEESRSALVRAETAYTDATERLAQARREAADAQTRVHELQVELLHLRQHAQTTNTRREQLMAELSELAAQAAALNERQAGEESRFQELDQELGSTQERQAELDEGVIAAEGVLSAAREQWRSLEMQAQEAQFSARTLAASRAELQRAIETAMQQFETNEQSAALAREELERLDDDTAQSGLQAALAQKLEREQALGAQRSEYDGLSTQLRQADEQRLELERSMQPLRDRIVKLQLEEQAASLGGAQYLEQLTQAQVDMTALAQRITEEKVRLPGLQGEIDRIHREVEALGAVNLAALDELTQSRERKAFLDAQVADLVNAIGTLEQAIHKIDLETRELLRTTFNAVNEHFGLIFPRLFGGGTARLVMTGDEILDAGVQVTAQPPGKKNSTIHLLSGGEKALTAIALVFAIFQLNPAPFCLLDEVDAPLDDANTERYAKLVQEMARETQFFFISHNKIAMEMAEQLIGVTMQEQGVSRIVAVDIQAAVGLAEAA